jgi:NAD(P)-dependent dehydrogenase (short-subunit alcohol dehydrogenase family)
MKQVLVAGGAGGVGEGIVRALLADGHTVIVPSRSAEKLALLRTRVGGAGRLVELIGHVGDEPGAEAIRDLVARDVGRLDTAIASLGGWWEAGPLLEITGAQWDELMNEFLRIHFVFARTFIPVLRAQPGGGRYIGIGGGAAYFPIPNAAPVCIGAAAQLMLTRALRAEVEDPSVDILELVADGPVRTRDSEAFAGDDWITADEIGAIVAELVVEGRTNDPGTTANGPILRMRPLAGRSVQ